MGVVIGSILLLPALITRHGLLLLLVAAFYVVAYATARGSPVAAALQLVAVNALGAAIWIDARPSVDTTGPVGWATLGVLALVELLMVRGLVGAIRSRRPRHVRPERGLERARRRLSRTLALRHAERLWPAAANYLLAALCALVVLAPSYPMIAAIMGRRAVVSIPEVLAGSPWWLGALALLTMLAGLGGAAFFFTRAKRLAALSAAQVTARDTRPPVLLLRSFRDDLTTLKRAALASSRGLRLSDLHARMWTLEETLETALSERGPVVAVGRPGEPVPPAGAARLYVPNDRWLERVEAHIRDSQLVVVVLGTTEGLRREYAALAALGALGKLIVVLPPRDTRELESRWSAFLRATNVAAGPGPGCPPTARVATFSREGMPRFVTCAHADETSYRLAVEHALRALDR
ncbi:MAG: hypothetical protein EHM59_02715 [Betaproteobacteria bacterium]|nr:MAG: hypothetical protein EHM59_02715 [Betaproteobacteria bacterium]